MAESASHMTASTAERLNRVPEGDGERVNTTGGLHSGYQNPSSRNGPAISPVTKAHTTCGYCTAIAAAVTGSVPVAWENADVRAPVEPIV